MSQIDEDFASLIRGGSADFRRTIVCKYCGKTDLSWEKEKDRWVLVYNEDGSLHQCIKDRQEITRCQYCGQAGLKWKLKGNNWTLVYPEDNFPHKCIEKEYADYEQNHRYIKKEGTANSM